MLERGDSPTELPRAKLPSGTSRNSRGTVSTSHHLSRGEFLGMRLPLSHPCSLKWPLTHIPVGNTSQLFGSPRQTCTSFFLLFSLDNIYLLCPLHLHPQRYHPLEIHNGLAAWVTPAHFGPACNTGWVDFTSLVLCHQCSHFLNLSAVIHPVAIPVLNFPHEWLVQDFSLATTVRVSG